MKYPSPVTWMACVAALGTFYGVEAVFRKDGVPLPSEPFRLLGAVIAFCLTQTIGCFFRRRGS